MTKNESELKEVLYKDVIALAVSLKTQGRTMTDAELTEWINSKNVGFEHKYGSARGVPGAAFRRATTAAEKEALVSVFVHQDGSPLWTEE